MRVLKHDFKSMGGSCVAAYILTVIVAVSNAVAGTLLYRANFLPHIMESLLELFFLISFILLFACGFMPLVAVVTDFYQSIFGKRAYLTHTLPVNTRTILLSKVLVSNVVIWISGFVVYLCFSLVMIAMDEFWFPIRDFEDLTALFSGFLMLASTLGLFLMVIYTAMALGHLTKHKIPVAVVVFILCNQIIMLLPYVIMVEMLEDILFSTDLGFVAGLFFLSLVYACIAVLLATLLFYVVLYVITHRLNLDYSKGNSEKNQFSQRPQPRRKETP